MTLELPYRKKKTCLSVIYHTCLALYLTYTPVSGPTMCKISCSWQKTFLLLQLNEHLRERWRRFTVSSSQRLWFCPCSLEAASLGRVGAMTASIPIFGYCEHRSIFVTVSDTSNYAKAISTLVTVSRELKKDIWDKNSKYQSKKQQKALRKRCHQQLSKALAQHIKQTARNLRWTLPAPHTHTHTSVSLCMCVCLFVWKLFFCRGSGNENTVIMRR